MDTMKLQGVVAIALIAGCGILAKVPAESKGDTPIKIDNGLDAKICFFAMTPRGAPTPSGNWLGSMGVDVGHQQEVSVKPGEYTLRIAGCDKQFEAERPIRIVQPTLISVGQATIGCAHCAIGVENGWAKEVVQVRGSAGMGSVSVQCFEAGTIADNPDDCCSGASPAGNKWRCGG